MLVYLDTAIIIYLVEEKEPFREFESARVTYLTKINFIDPASHDGIGPILASTQCEFRKE